MVSIRTRFLGKELASPIIAGSAGITGTLDLLRKAEDAGAGAVITKGISDQSLMRKSPSPRYTYMARGSSKTLYSYEQASELGPEAYAELVAKAKAALGIPVFVNVDCHELENWEYYCRLMEQAGADGLELNVSCPHGSITFNGEEVEQQILAVVRLVRSVVKIPFLLKLSPQLTQPLSMAQEALRLGADGLTLFNRLTGLELDPETQTPIMHGGYAGHGGRWALQYVLRWVSAVYKELKPTLSASGGVGSSEDVIRALLAGATTVQVCSAVYLEGYQIIRTLNKGLLTYLERHGFSSVAELRGAAVKKIKGMAEVDREVRWQAKITTLGTAPCTAACPAEQEAAGYIALIAAGRDAEALALIKRHNPFPAICGRVCHHPCETKCTRSQIDAPLSIAALKRFVADREGELGLAEAPLKATRPEKIAIVGSGPAGLTCAIDLLRAGFPVTVFEALPQPGGMLVAGIPAHRLPREVITQEIEALCRQGVAIKTNCQIGRDLTLNDLQKQGFATIVLACGAQAPRQLGIPGEELEGVISGLEFLRRHNLGEKVSVPQRVVVIGGGNVAIDAARTAWRLGADTVTLLYRRSKAEMPADPEEVQLALEEGIELQELASPLRIIGRSKAQGVLYELNRLGAVGADGRPTPEPTGEQGELAAELVLVCVGQEASPEFLKGTDLTLDKGLLPVISGQQTALPGVFAGGDLVSGPATVVEAIAAGHRLARAVMRSHGLDAPEPVQPPVAGENWEKPEVVTCRQPKEYLPVSERRNFDPVDLGLTEARARAEAKRCLHCSGCVNCGRCSTICLYEAIAIHLGHSVVTDKCAGCGLCQYLCLTGAIKMELKKDENNN